jgi:hypothetical protein
MMLRTIIATAILLLWAAVIVEGAIRGTYAGPIGAMTPIVALAAGFLFGRDAIDAVLDRRDRRKENDPDAGPAQPDEA